MNHFFFQGWSRVVRTPNQLLSKIKECQKPHFFCVLSGQTNVRRIDLGGSQLKIRNIGLVGKRLLQNSKNATMLLQSWDVCVFCCRKLEKNLPPKGCSQCISHCCMRFKKKYFRDLHSNLICHALIIITPAEMRKRKFGAPPPPRVYEPPSQ